MDHRASEITVWDPLVRIFHWSVALVVFVALITEDDVLGLHVLTGYVVLGLVLVRILWGLVGTRHARFSDFIFPPRAVTAYLKDLVRLRAPRHLGHGPAGGSMVMALLISLLMVSLSGLVVYGGQEYQGPLAPMMPNVGGLWILAAEKAHEFFAGLTVFLVCIHVAGVLFSSFAHRENLIKAMLTGTKRADTFHQKRPEQSDQTFGTLKEKEPNLASTAILQ